MKTVSAKLPDASAARLKALTATLKVPVDELIARSLEEYPAKLEKIGDFGPIGFGMWKDREEMQDSAAKRCATIPLWSNIEEHLFCEEQSTRQKARLSSPGVHPECPFPIALLRKIAQHEAK